MMWYKLKWEGEVLGSEIGKSFYFRGVIGIWYCYLNIDIPSYREHFFITRIGMSRISTTNIESKG